MFYSSIRLVFKTAFISEKIEENRFGALLEIGDKFITKFNVFSLILQIKKFDFAVQALNSMENLKTILHDFKNSG